MREIYALCLNDRHIVEGRSRRWREPEIRHEGIRRFAIGSPPDLQARLAARGAWKPAILEIGPPAADGRTDFA